MRPLLEFLGLTRAQVRSDPSGDTATVRRIVAQLEELPPERARYVAAFAYLLSRVANADLEITADETVQMEIQVRELASLPEEQAVLVVEIAKVQSRLLGGTENFQVAREFRELATKVQQRQLLHCLFAVAAADGEISNVEEAEIRRIADELALTHKDLVEARSEFNELRTVIKALGERS